MPWKKGQSGNPAGKPKTDARKLLEAAIAAESKKRGKSLYQHMVERAFEDDTVLLGLARKLLPDLRSIDANIGQLEPFRLILTNGHRSTKPDGGDSNSD
jgi:hypothetical protein